MSDDDDDDEQRLRRRTAHVESNPAGREPRPAYGSQAASLSRISATDAFNQDDRRQSPDAYGRDARRSRSPERWSPGRSRSRSGSTSRSRSRSRSGPRRRTHQHRRAFSTSTLDLHARSRSRSKSPRHRRSRSRHQRSRSRRQHRRSRSRSPDRGHNSAGSWKFGLELDPPSKGEQEAILSVSLGECWEPPPEVIQDIPKIFNKILRGAP
jgi:hypothetical protein